MPATQWRKKPVVIEATQWFKNGDHPFDYHGRPVSRMYGHEGAVVRYFRRPDVPGDSSCKQCARPMHAHGWIDTLEGGHIVCPGDWIITGVQGERYPCKPAIFAATYEPAEELSAAQQPDDGATREALEDAEFLYLVAGQYEALRLGVEKARLLCAIADRLKTAALSQRPRAETPTDDKRDAARWRKVRPSLTTVGEDVAYLSVFDDAPSSHPGATVEDIVDALEADDAKLAIDGRMCRFHGTSWDLQCLACAAAMHGESTSSPAPRVPEAGSAPLPNEDSALLDALDAMREVVVRATMPDGEPELIAHAWGVYGQCETVREALRAHVLRDSQPSASTTGEA